MEYLKNMLHDFNITLHAYCLMSNHYHLLLETKEKNISEAMQYLNGSYSTYFNKKHKRTGHLWQGRYLSYYLYDDAHAWIVAKYIEQNPIKAGMVNDILEYSHQSLNQWNNKQKYLELLEGSLIFDMTLKEYIRYCNEQMSENEFIKIYATPKIVVKDGKVKILNKRLESFFEADKDINRKQNAKRAFEYGYTKTEIAKFLGVTTKTLLNWGLTPKREENLDSECKRG